MKNKGFSLVEVIVSSVIIGLLLISLVTAFAAVRKVNTASSKQDAAISLSSALFEGLRGKRYDSITEATFQPKNIDGISLPGFEDTSLTVGWSEEGDTKIATLHNIVKDLGTFKVTVEMKPSDLKHNEIKVNDYQFPRITDIALDSTVIIDIKTMTVMYNEDRAKNDGEGEDGSYIADYKYSYDNLVLNELRDKNKTYMQKQYDEICKQIKETNEEFKEAGKPEELWLKYPLSPDEADYSKRDVEDETGFRENEFALTPDEILKTYVSRKMMINTKKYNDEYSQLDCTLTYSIDDNIAEFGEPIKPFEYEIYSSKYIDKLENLYLVYDYNGTSFKNELKEDSIELINGTESSNNDALSYNLFFIVGNLFNNEYTKRANINVPSPIDKFVLNFNQKYPTSLVNLYTNIEVRPKNFTYEYTEFASITYDMYVSQDKYTRLYDVNITVEDENGTNLYSETKSSILK